MRWSGMAVSGSLRWRPLIQSASYDLASHNLDLKTDLTYIVSATIRLRRRGMMTIAGRWWWCVMVMLLALTRITTIILWTEERAGPDQYRTTYKIMALRQDQKAQNLRISLRRRTIVILRGILRRRVATILRWTWRRIIRHCA